MRCAATGLPAVKVLDLIMSSVLQQYFIDFTISPCSSWRAVTQLRVAAHGMKLMQLNILLAEEPPAVVARLLSP